MFFFKTIRELKSTVEVLNDRIDNLTRDNGELYKRLKMLECYHSKTDFYWVDYYGYGYEKCKTCEKKVTHFKSQYDMLKAKNAKKIAEVEENKRELEKLK